MTFVESKLVIQILMIKKQFVLFYHLPQMVPFLTVGHIIIIMNNSIHTKAIIIDDSLYESILDLIIYKFFSHSFSLKPRFSSSFSQDQMVAKG